MIILWSGEVAVVSHQYLTQYIIRFEIPLNNLKEDSS